MTSRLANLMRAGADASQTVRDAVVVCAMAFVTLAAIMALHLHLGLSVSRAIVAGTLIFGLFVATHFLFVPREKQYAKNALEDEELWRALREQREQAPDADRMAMATRTEPPAPAPHLQVSDADKVGAVRDDQAPAPVPSLEGLSKPRRKPRIIKTTPAAPLAADPTALQGPHVDQQDPDLREGSAGQDWSFRPGLVEDAPDQGRDTHADVAPQARHVESSDASSDEAASDPSPPDAGPSPRESDVEMVGSLIRELAHKVNAEDMLAKSALDQAAAAASETETSGASANEGSPQLPSKTEPAQPAGQSDVGSAQPPSVAPPPLPNVATAAADTADQTAHGDVVDPPAPPAAPSDVDLVTQSIAALRTTAGTMREANAAVPDDAPQIEQPLRPVAAPDAKQLGADISNALSAGQFGVYLDPVLSLDGLTADHFEVGLRVHHPSFEALPEGEIEPALAGADVLAHLDQVRFEKTVQVADVLRTRGREGLIFVPVYRESLSDRHFCYTVASNGVAHEQLAQQLVLVLRDDAVLALTASEWQTLSELGELGYRFALHNLPNVELDFAQLAAAGFSFLKVDATVLVDRAADDASGAAGQDGSLAQETAAANIAVMVAGLQDAKVAATCQALGAALGQGPLSGGPRLMKADAIAQSTVAVA